MKEPELLSRRTAYQGSFLRLVAEEVRLPNGRVAELEVVRHPGAAAVVPLLPGGEVALLRQYRHAVGRWLLEVPAGKLDPGESPQACARRELTEETGLTAGSLVDLGRIWPSPGFTDEAIHLFLARVEETDGAAGRQSLDRDEVLTVERLPLEQAVILAAGGEISDGKTACALLRAAHHLRARLDDENGKE